MTRQCDFTVVEYGEPRSLVRCTACGRTVKVASSTLGRVYAACRGDEETRWTKSGDPIAEPSGGPGTELKAILATIGIVAKPDCSCHARARVMDRQGCDWCEQHLDTIVGWLREEATKRGLPFLDAAGRLLVRRAIRNPRRAAG